MTGREGRRSTRAAAGRVPPSGAQHALAFGDQRATAVEVGAALRAYEVGGVAVIDGFSLSERCTGARGQILVPWPNRLRDGRYSLAGEEHQLALTEPGKHNAIHGLVRWTNFAERGRSPSAVTLTHTLYPQPGYPFTLAITIRYELSEAGLRVTTTSKNLGDRSAPYGCGAHPYLTLPMPTIDGAILEAPGRTRLLTDEQGIPIGREEVHGTVFDFGTPRPIAGTQLDTAFTDLARDGDGLAWVHLRTREGRRASLWCDEAYPYLMLFTGDSLADAAHRRTGLGVEPMTCAPDAFRSNEGLTILEPGQSHQASWGLVATP